MMHICWQCSMLLANFHLELWRATYSGLEITGSVSTLNLYRVSTILDVALVATTVLLPSFLSRRCVSLTNTFFSCCYFGCFWIIFYYRLLYGIVNKYRSMCWIQWIVVYGRGNCLQCCCAGTYAYHRVVQVMTLELSPVVVCKCPVCFYVTCGVTTNALE